MFNPKFDFGDVVYWIADSAVHRGTVRGISIETGYGYKEEYDVVVPQRYGNAHHSLDVRELYICKEDAEEIIKDEQKEYRRLRLQHLEDTIKAVESQLATLMEEKEELTKGRQ